MASMQALCFLAHAAAETTGAMSLVDSWDELHRDLSCIGSVRTPRAHGTVLSTRKQCTRYLSLVERWLERLFDRCPIGCSIAQIEAIAEPLPLVDAEGNLEWIEAD